MSVVTNLDVQIRAVGGDKYSKSVDRSIKDTSRLQQSLTGFERFAASDPFRSMGQSLTGMIPGLDQVIDSIRLIGDLVKSTPTFSSTSAPKPLVVTATADKVAQVASTSNNISLGRSAIAAGAGAAGASATAQVVDLGGLSKSATVASASIDRMATTVAESSAVANKALETIATETSSVAGAIERLENGVDKFVSSLRSAEKPQATYKANSGKLGVNAQSQQLLGVSASSTGTANIGSSADEFQRKIGQSSKSFGDKVKDAARSAWKTIDNGATAYYNFVVKSSKAAVSFIDRAGERFDRAVIKMAKAAPGVAGRAAVGGAKALAGATILGVVAGATAGALNVGPAIDRLDQLSDAAAKAGTDVNQLRQIRFSLGEGSGAAAEDVDKAVIALQRSLTGAVNGSDAAAQKAFERLGIDAGEAMAQGPLEAMQQIADGFANISDPGERLQLSMDLMGKSGIAIAAGLSGGRDALADSLAFAQKNLTVSEESAALAGQFNDLWDRFKLTLDGVYERFAARLLPSLISFFDLISDSAGGAGVLETVLGGVADFLELGAEWTYSTFQYLGKAYDIASALARLDYSGATAAYDREIKSFSDLARATRANAAAEAESRKARKADAAALERAAELEEQKTQAIKDQTAALEEQAKARDKAGKDTYDDIEAQILAAKRLADYLKKDPTGGQAAFDRAEAGRKFAEQVGDQDPLGDRRAVFEQQLIERDAANAEVKRQQAQASTIEQFRTPLEVFEDRMAELADIFKGTDLFDPRLERAQKAARDEFEKASGIDRTQGSTSGAAIESGSTALYQLLLAGRKSTEDPAVRVAQQQVDAQLEGNKVMAEIRDKIQANQSIGIIE